MDMGCSRYAPRMGAASAVEATLPREPGGSGARLLYFLSRVCYIADMRWREPAYAALYLSLECAFVYGVWNVRVGFGESVAAAVLIVVFVLVVNVGLGFAVGSWWALLLPHALVLLAVPAGFPPGDDREPLPIWLVLAWLTTFQVLLVALGVAAHKLRSGPARRRGAAL